MVIRLKSTTFNMEDVYKRQIMNTIKLKKNALFNPEGDTGLRHRRMIGGNTTNLNDVNNMRYKWVSDWYRQAMNNFWIPEEINLTQDTKDCLLYTSQDIITIQALVGEVA